MRAALGSRTGELLGKVEYLDQLVQLADRDAVPSGDGRGQRGDHAHGSSRSSFRAGWSAMRATVSVSQEAALELGSRSRTQRRCGSAPPRRSARLWRSPRPRGRASRLDTPGQLHLALAGAERAVFAGVGGQLVQHQGQAERGLGRELQLRPVDLNVAIVLAEGPEGWSTTLRKSVSPQSASKIRP